MEDITYGGQGAIGGQQPVAAQPLGAPASTRVPGAVSSGGVVSASAAKKEIKIFKLGLIVAGVVILGLVIGLIVLGAQYSQTSADVNGQIATAVAVAKEEQQAESDAYWAEEMKKPELKFTGPADYGTLSFDYPRTWATYVSKDATKGGDYEAYLNFKTVPTAPSSASSTTTSRFALRVAIYAKSYDDVLKPYSSAIDKGEIISSIFTINREDKATVTGARLDGLLSKDGKASAIFFKLRDKTVMLRTDGTDYLEDFNALIQTVDFND